MELQIGVADCSIGLDKVDDLFDATLKAHLVRLVPYLVFRDEIHLLEVFDAVLHFLDFADGFVVELLAFSGSVRDMLI